MMEADKIAPPDNARLAQALQASTQRLCAELTTPQTVAPDWDATHWRLAMAAVAIHGIAGLLARRLRWQGPALWQDFLAEQRQQTGLREQRARELLVTLNSATRHAGIAALALKGSALLAMGLYEDDERPMSDIDLLVRPQDMETTEEMVEVLGYIAHELGPRHRQYQPSTTPPERAFGEHLDNPLKIELHDHIAEPLPRRSVALTSELWPDAPRAGLNAYPGRAALMRHLLLHAAGNCCHHSIRLIQLHDIVLLGERLTAAEWQQVLDSGRAAGADWVYPPLALASRCLPGRLPDEVLQAAARLCPPWLRRSADRWTLDGLSFTGLYMPVLPGLPWCTSAGELMALLARRLYPGRQALTLARGHLQTQAPLRASPQAGRPRWQRALDWLQGQPPRVQTVYMVNQALHYRPPASSSYSPSTQEAV